MQEFAKKFGAGAALLTVMALAAPAQAGTFTPIPGTGYSAFASGVSGVGDSGVDAFGNTWNWNYTVGGITPGVGAGDSAWGTPGLGNAPPRSTEAAPRPWTSKSRSWSRSGRRAP